MSSVDSKPAANNTSSSSKTIPKNVTISNHPLLQHKISILRSSATNQNVFRSVLREVTYHLGYEATSTLQTKEIPISVSVGKDNDANNQVDCTGFKITEQVALIPILRSGLGMSDAMIDLLPQASVHHIGMYHLPGSVPVQYFNRLPKQCTSDIAYVVDPVIASAETMMAVLANLKRWGVPKIHVISVLSSDHGLKTLTDAHPDVQFTIAHVDDVLAKDGTVLPGLGDAGDRLFGGTISASPNQQQQQQQQQDEEDERLLHPSKRKRTMSKA